MQLSTDNSISHSEISFILANSKILEILVVVSNNKQKLNLNDNDVIDDAKYSAHAESQNFDEFCRMSFAWHLMLL